MRREAQLLNHTSWRPLENKRNIRGYRKSFAFRVLCPISLCWMGPNAFYCYYGPFWLGKWFGFLCKKRIFLQECEFLWKLFKKHFFRDWEYCEAFSIRIKGEWIVIHWKCHLEGHFVPLWKDFSSFILFKIFLQINN